MDAVQALGQKLNDLYRLKAQGAQVDRVIADTERQLRDAVDERIDARQRQEAREKESHLRGH